MKLLLVYIEETDGPIVTREFDSKEEVKQFLAKERLHASDWALISGEVLITFDQELEESSYAISNNAEA